MTRRLVAGAAVVLLTAAAAIAGAEMALRLVGIGDPIVYYTNMTYRFAPAPNQKVTRPKGVEITINDRGLRATRPWAAPADLRILFLGDSVTWGTSAITDADTFSERTCVAVTRETGLRATCGNGGVNAYGTDNMAQRIRFKPFDDEDWIVVVVLSGDALRTLQNIGAGHYHMVKPTGPLRAIWEMSTYAAVRLEHILRGTNDREPPERANAIARDSVRNLMNVLRERQAAGKRVLAVLTVGREEVEGAEFSWTPGVRDEMRRSGLPFLDLAPVIRNNFRTYFYIDTAHLSPYGNNVFAEAIAAHIVAAERVARGPLSPPAGR